MLQVGTRLDRYVVEEEVGRGAFAVVYRVRHTELDVPYAIKLLTVSGETIRKRLLQEGRLQASIQHPNVVRVVDVLTVDGHPALVEDYVNGPTLDVYLERNPLDRDQRLRLFRQVVEGVAAAHALHIIHRDLKPPNVLVEQREGVPIARVSDFGIARAISEERSAIMTLGGIALGTPAYMAPEQGRDPRRADHRSDIFALGCILYELLSNQMTFPMLDIGDCLRAAAQGDYIPLEDLDPDIPPRLCKLVRSCLMVDPQKRPYDCKALLVELETTSARIPTLIEIGSPAAAPPQQSRTFNEDIPANIQSSQQTEVMPTPEGSMQVVSAGAVTVVSAGGVTVKGDAQPSIGKWIFVLGVGGLMIAGAGILTIWLLRPSPSPPVVSVTEIPISPPVSAPAAPPTPPRVDPRPTVATRSRPTSEAAPQKETRSNDHPPEVKPLPDGKVVLVGALPNAWLSDGETRYGLSAPAGSYHLYVQFSGADAQDVGVLRLEAGRSINVYCNEGFSICKLNP